MGTLPKFGTSPPSPAIGKSLAIRGTPPNLAAVTRFCLQTSQILTERLL
jgi:hypothetical protein